MAIENVKLQSAIETKDQIIKSKIQKANEILLDDECTLPLKIRPDEKLLTNEKKVEIHLKYEIINSLTVF